MNEQISLLNKKFLEIKKMGWIKSKRKGHTGVGMTFEYLLGTNENNFEIPDFNGIEIKTKRNYSKSYTTLFNCTPEGKHYHEVERIKDEYGYSDAQFRQYKVLNNSIFANQSTLIGNRFYFQLEVNRKKQKIYLNIFDKNGVLIDDEIYWDFEILKEKLYRKLKYIAFIDAQRSIKDNEEYFKYYKLTIYSLKSFDTFIDLIEKGIIRITFKLSVFKKGKRMGQLHDHGTGFDIEECNLLKLYNIYSY